MTETKESSEAIAKSLEESYAIKKDLSKEYVKYQPLAEYGATLFFACTTLSKLNNMYHLSVSTFIKLYQKSLSSSHVSNLFVSFVIVLILRNMFCVCTNIFWGVI